MASGRRSVTAPPKPAAIAVARSSKEAAAPRGRASDGAGGGASSAAPAARQGPPPELGRVRVWWEPTDDKTRSGFGGAWWPAQVVSTNEKKNRIRVRYDNGEEDDVHTDHVSPLDTLPVEFGQEAFELRPGEFCEVHNGSKTDPGAWLGRVVRLRNGIYKVEYPFHDSKPEKIKAERVRRARIMEDGEWRLIKPEQVWSDGEVTSPKELELILEDDLDDFLQDPGTSAGDEDDKAAAKKKRDSKSGEQPSSSRPSKQPRPEAPAPRAEAPSPRPPHPELGRAHSVASPSAPPGMVSMYLVMEAMQRPGGGLGFVPVHPSSSAPVPPGAIQAYLPSAEFGRYDLERKQQKYSVNVRDTEDVLRRGIDMKRLQVQLEESGYPKQAFQLVQEAWRTDAPNIANTLRAYRAFVHEKHIDRVDWDGFMAALLGPDKVKALKAEASGAGTREGH